MKNSSHINLSSRCPKCHQHHVVNVDPGDQELEALIDIWAVSDCPKCSPPPEVKPEPKSRPKPSKKVDRFSDDTFKIHLLSWRAQLMDDSINIQPEQVQLTRLSPWCCKLTLPSILFQDAKSISYVMDINPFDLTVEIFRAASSPVDNLMFMQCSCCGVERPYSDIEEIMEDNWLPSASTDGEHEDLDTVCSNCCDHYFVSDDNGYTFNLAMALDHLSHNPHRMSYTIKEAFSPQFLEKIMPLLK